MQPRATQQAAFRGESRAFSADSGTEKFSPINARPPVTRCSVLLRPAVLKPGWLLVGRVAPSLCAHHVAASTGVCARAGTGGVLEAFFTAHEDGLGLLPAPGAAAEEEHGRDRALLGPLAPRLCAPA